MGRRVTASILFRGEGRVLKKEIKERNFQISDLQRLTSLRLGFFSYFYSSLHVGSMFFAIVIKIHMDIMNKISLYSIL